MSRVPKALLMLLTSVFKVFIALVSFALIPRVPTVLLMSCCMSRREFSARVVSPSMLMTGLAFPAACTTSEIFSAAASLLASMSAMSSVLPVNSINCARDISASKVLPSISTTGFPVSGSSTEARKSPNFTSAG